MVRVSTVEVGIEATASEVCVRTKDKSDGTETTVTCVKTLVLTLVVVPLSAGMDTVPEGKEIVTVAEAEVAFELSVAETDTVAEAVLLSVMVADTEPVLLSVTVAETEAVLLSVTVAETEPVLLAVTVAETEAVLLSVTVAESETVLLSVAVAETEAVSLSVAEVDTESVAVEDDESVEVAVSVKEVGREMEIGMEILRPDVEESVAVVVPVVSVGVTVDESVIVGLAESVTVEVAESVVEVSGSDKVGMVKDIDGIRPVSVLEEETALEESVVVVGDTVAESVVVATAELLAESVEVADDVSDVDVGNNVIVGSDRDEMRPVSVLEEEAALISLDELVVLAVVTTESVADAVVLAEVSELDDGVMGRIDRGRDTEIPRMPDEVEVAD